VNQEFRDAELEGWTLRAEGYDAHFRAISDQLTGAIEKALGQVSGKRVLDVCCGPGHLANAFSAKGADVVGIDFAPTMIELAARHYPDRTFAVGDAEFLEYTANEFDHVVCAYGVMHLGDPDKAIAEAYRVLRPGGTYVFSQWADDDELLSLVSNAVKEHGGPVTGLPEAPPPMRFSNPSECSRTLALHGFIECEVKRVDVRWHGQSPKDVLRLIQEAATRAALLIETQAPGRRAAIEAAIIDKARQRSEGEGVTLRRPTLLASGRKPG
jgi:SAM-dependent methyltransferase